jgi:hypothetical protein
VMGGGTGGGRVIELFVSLPGIGPFPSGIFHSELAGHAPDRAAFTLVCQYQDPFPVWHVAGLIYAKKEKKY